VKLTREQLAASKIGVAIGDVLGNRKLQKLWPLAQALINWFILALPKATLQAIQNYHEVHAAAQTDLDAAKETIAAAVAEGGDVAGTRSRTLDKIVAVFSEEKETISNLGPNFNVTSFVEAFFASIRNSDSKRQFLAQLGKPGHGKLRRQLLTGSISAEEFSQLSASAFITDEELNAEDAKIQELIRAQEEEDRINSIGTTMFECPNCHKKNATYHEQQTRGADEPTTKFVNCLECKHRWTTE
jgi:transcription elongation factor S-II